MWESINHSFIIAEVILAALFVYTLVRKNRAGTMAVALFIFLLNLGLYLVPMLYARLVLGTQTSFLMGLWECISASIKQLVGEVRTEAVIGYANFFPEYIYAFGIGAFLAVAVSFSAAIGVFGGLVKNTVRRWARMQSGICDVVCGINDAALDYAQKTKGAVLLVDEKTEKSVTDGLIADGYVILKKKFTAKLLKSHLFGYTTDYNFLLFNDGNFLEHLNVIAQYVESGKVKKAFRFFVEVDASMNEAAQNKLTYLLSPVKDGALAARYRESITLFSREELIARTLVEEHPMTKYLPQKFIRDGAMLPNCEMQAIFLGMTPLSREIYKQFVINHQFSEWNGSEYVAKTLSYTIYDQKVRESEWEFGGLEHELARCAEHKDAYFPLPAVPYHTKCHNEDPTLANLEEIAECIRHENCYTYVFIDVGNSNKNIELANRLKQHLVESKGYHLFVCDMASMADADDEITEYGNPYDVLCHDIIVDETLTELARSINREYCVLYGDCDGLSPEAAEAVCEYKWYATPYFKRYSNVSLANNLRLKLNLLGLDYQSGEDAESFAEIEAALGEKTETYDGYFTQTCRNALLAQEHFRWNAYHMMNGYLPMKKADIIMEKAEPKQEENNEDKKKFCLFSAIKTLLCRKKPKADEPEKIPRKKDHIKEDHQSAKNKRHACLTDYRGLDELSEELARRATAVCEGEFTFTAEEFDYFQNDGMLLSVAPKYFEREGLRVVKLRGEANETTES